MVRGVAEVPEIFQYSFMVRALVAGVVIGVVAPLIGTFLVLRRFAFFADTKPHYLQRKSPGFALRIGFPF